MTQITLEERVRSAATENARLLKTLSETDYALAARQQNDNYIQTLKKQIADEERKCAALKRKVADEYADHKKYRDSHARRWAHKISGKKERFEEKATKEEREWLEAIQSELSAKNGLEHLKSNLVDAEAMGAELMDVSQVHGQAQIELDEIYNQIFEGPTPSVPEEDEKEREAGKAGTDFNAAQLLLSTEKQADAILRDCYKVLTRARESLMQALNSSDLDLWGVGGTWVQAQESNSLSIAQNNVHQAEMLLSQAQRMQPAIGHLGAIRIEQMNFMSDIFFDNIFTDLARQDKIMQSSTEVASALNRIRNEMSASEQRVKTLQVQCDQAKSTLDGKRDELQRVRAGVFERVSRGNPITVAPEAPPSYDTAPPSYVE